jgi:hypothetical protein
MSSEDDDEYNYSDEDGYSVEEEDSNMEWESNDNPNAAPMQYKVSGGGEYSRPTHTCTCIPWTSCHFHAA